MRSLAASTQKRKRREERENQPHKANFNKEVHCTTKIQKYFGIIRPIYLQTYLSPQHISQSKPPINRTFSRAAKRHACASSYFTSRNNTRSLYSAYFNTPWGERIIFKSYECWYVQFLYVLVKKPNFQWLHLFKQQLNNVLTTTNY